MKIPLKDSVKFPCQENTAVTSELKTLLRELKMMGVDTNELKRQAITQAALNAKRALDKRAS